MGCDIKFYISFEWALCKSLIEEKTSLSTRFTEAPLKVKAPGTIFVDSGSAEEMEQETGCKNMSTS